MLYLEGHPIRAPGRACFVQIQKMLNIVKVVVRLSSPMTLKIHPEWPIGSRVLVGVPRLSREAAGKSEKITGQSHVGTDSSQLRSDWTQT